MRRKRISSLVFAFFLVFTTVLSSYKSVGGVVFGSSNAEYTGHTHYLGKHIYFSVVKNDTGETMPAYCWDARLGRPSDVGYSSGNWKNEIPTGYDERDVKLEDGEWFATETTRKILYNGYPTNAANIQEIYGLTDQEFQIVTQKALWKQREGDNYSGISSFWRPDKKLAYAYNMLLTGQPLQDPAFLGNDEIGAGKVNLQEPPENFKVRLIWNGELAEIGKPKNQRLAIVEYKSTPSIKFSKKDSKGKFLSGIEFVLENEDGREIQNWTSENRSREIELPEIESDAIYTIKEKAPLAGFEKADDIKFKIRKQDNGKYSISRFNNQRDEFEPEVALTFKHPIDMINFKEKANVKFKKIGNNNEVLANAGFEVVLKENNKKLTEFVSDTSDSGKVVQLEKNTSYILKEVNVPFRYIKMADVNFDIDGNGNISIQGNRDDVKVNGDTIILKNKLSERPFIEFAKIDSLGKNISGARMKLTADTDSEVFEAEGINVTRERTGLQEINPKGMEVTRYAKGEEASLVTNSVQVSNIEGSYDKFFKQVTLDDGSIGLQLKMIMNPSNESWGLRRPMYFFTVPKGLVVEKINLKETEYTPANYPNASRIYKTGDEYSNEFDRMVKSNSAPFEIMSTKAENSAIVGDWESGGTSGEFAITLKVIDPSVIGTRVNVLTGMMTNPSTLNKGYVRVIKSSVTIPGKIESYSKVARWESGNMPQGILLNLDKTTNFTLEEEQAPEGFVDNRLRTNFSVDVDGNITMNEFSDVEDGSKARKLITINPNNQNQILIRNEYNNKVDISISKKDIFGNNLAGASFELLGIDNSVVATFDTTNQNKTLNISPGRYYLRETIAPSGYKQFSENIAFDVSIDGNITLQDTENPLLVAQGNTLKVTNEKTSHEIVINKLDDNSANMANVSFELIKEKDGTKTEFTTVANAQTLNLESGYYTLKEKSAPQGFEKVKDIRFEVNQRGEIENLTFNLDDSVSLKNKNQIDIVNKKEKKNIVVSKVNEEDEGLASAKIRILEKSSNKIVAEWLTAKNKTDKELHLSPGTYIFNELSAPNGYDKVSNFEFTVNAQGDVVTTNAPNTVARVSNSTLKVIDKKIKPTVYISKRNIAGEEIQGAQIKITNKDGSDANVWDQNYNLIENGQWTSEVSSSKKIHLEPGEYKFKEVAAPNGYIAVTDISFKVFEDGTVKVLEKDADVIADVEGNNLLVVVDNAVGSKKITFSKVDLSGTEIEGARIVIKKDNNIVADWISEAGKNHEVSLKAGKYTFKEVSAPTGYQAITEFTFNVLDDGTVSFDQIREGEFEYRDGKIIVTNKPQADVVSNDGREFVFAKKDAKGNLLENAVIEINKKTAGAETLVARWTTTAEEKTVKLTDGNYILKEVVAPAGFEKIRSFEFSVAGEALTIVDLNDNRAQDIQIDSNKISVVDQAVKNEVLIDKVDIIGNEIAGASIKIYDDTNNIVSEWTSQAGKVHKLALSAGTYKFEEVVAPQGYDKVETLVKFTIDANGQIKDVKMLEGNAETDVRNAKDDNGIATDKKLVSAKENLLTVINEKHTTAYRTGELSTTVKIGEQIGSAQNELLLQYENATQPVNIVDTIEYSNLVPNETYQVTTTLKKIVDDQVVDVLGADNNPVVKTSRQTASDSGTGRWEIGFDNPVQLEENSKYIVFERAESVNDHTIIGDNDQVVVGKHTAIHEDKEDKAQTIVVSEESKYAQGTLKTTVKVGDKMGAENKELSLEFTEAQRVIVKDTINYTGLVPNGEYNITTSLMKIVDGQAEAVKDENQAPITKMSRLVASANGTGDWEITFDNPVQLEENSKYVIFERAESVNEYKLLGANGEVSRGKHTAIHEDKEDKAQTIVVSEESKYAQGTLKTTVKVGDKMGAENKELSLEFTEAQRVIVKDTINYTGLVPNGEYNITTSLMKIVDGQAEPVKDENQAPITKTSRLVASADGTGDWEITFDNPVQLEENSKYVIFERAESVNEYKLLGANGEVSRGKHTAIHEDKEDKAQTIVVRKSLKDVLISKKSLGGEEVVGATIQILGAQGETVRVLDKDSVEIENGTFESTKEDKLIKLEAGDYKFIEKVAPKGYTVVTGIEFSVDENGLVSVKNTEITGGEAVYEDGKLKVTDNYDKDQFKDAVISKKASLDAGEELVGATIEIKNNDAEKSTAVVLDREGSLIENGSWVSTNQPKEIKLLPGNYIFRETTAPTNYKVVNDIEFTVLEDGTINVTNVNGNTAEYRDGKLVVVDEIDDTLPTFIAGTLRTVAKVGENLGEADKEISLEADQVKEKVTIEDKITYTNLIPNEEYTVTTTLVKVVGDVATPVSDENNNIITKQSTLFADQTGSGVFEVRFDDQVKLEHGSKYVIFEEAVSKNKHKILKDDNTVVDNHRVEHKDVNDKAQTIIVKEEPKYEAGTMKTTVSVSGAVGSDISPATLPAIAVNNPVVVKDDISYEKLVPSENYTITTTLKKIVGNQAVDVLDANGMPVKKITELRSSENGKGVWSITFDNPIKLEVGAKYVIFENAVSENEVNLISADGQVNKGKHIVNHQDINDKAQSIVVEREVVEPKEDHNFIKGSLSTTAKANGVKSTPLSAVSVSEEKAENPVKISDIIDFTNLVPNETYTVTTTLKKVVDNQVVDVVDETGAPVVETTKLTTSSSGSGRWEVAFINPLKLEIGARYVIFEKAISDNDHKLIDDNGNVTRGRHTVIHEDKNDLAQTIVVGISSPEKIGFGKGSLATTVIANGKTGNIVNSVHLDDIEVMNKIQIRDKIHYLNLIPEETYKVTTTLVKIEDDQAVLVKGDNGFPVVKTTNMKADITGNGLWEVKFDKLVQLEPDGKYVIFEIAESMNSHNILDESGNVFKGKHVVFHENNNDIAQTIIVDKPLPEKTYQDGTLRTTVEVKGVQGNIDKEAIINEKDLAEPVYIKDIIDYGNLIANEEYVITTRLMMIDDKGNLTEVAKETFKMISSDTGNGTWTVEFSKPIKLDINSKYVIFENAESVNFFEFKDENAQGGRVERKQMAIHEDKNDKSQTIVTKETPKKDDIQEEHNNNKDQNKNNDDKKKKTPDTSDDRNFVAELFLLLSSILTVLVLKKKKI